MVFLLKSGDMNEQVARAVALFLGDGVTRDVPAAVRLLTEAAEAGHPTAQRNLGLLYRDGSGVPKNDTLAFEWLEKAALGGDGIAQDELGDLYANGRGTSKDLFKSFSWYEKAAQSGNPSAQTNLGYAFDVGIGTTPDSGRAVLWYRRGAEQGDAAKLLNGAGTPKDEAAAVVWLRKAVAQDYAPAFDSLGYAYDVGTGVTKDRCTELQRNAVCAMRKLISRRLWKRARAFRRTSVKR